jgi:hypothetical protein
MFEIDWQIVFSNLVLSYKLDIFWLECEKDENPQVHFRTPLIQKLKIIIFHLLTTTRRKSQFCN